jgi:hypothetical protein
LNETSPECEFAKVYFFKNVDWIKAIHEIDKIVLFSFKCDGKVTENETVHNWIHNLKNDTTQDSKKRFTRISRSLI